MLHRRVRRPIVSCLIAALAVLPGGSAVAESEAVTAKDPSVPVAELELLLTPLRKAELEVEAAAWLGLLQAKVQELTNAEVAVKYKNLEIEKAEKAAEAAAEAKEAVEEAQQTPASDTDAAKKAAAAAEEARKAAEEAAQAEQRTEREQAIKEATKAAETEAEQEAEKTDDKQLDVTAADVPAIQAPESTDAAELEQVAQSAQQAAEAKVEVKSQLLDHINTLRDERAALVERVNVVLAELKKKGGDVQEMELYVAAVSGIRLDTSDASALWATIMGWATSLEGGLKWAANVGRFLAVLIAFWLLAIVLGRVTDRAMKMNKGLSHLMKKFISTSVRRLVIVIGVVVAVAALGVNTAPMLAAIGATGLVVGLALQGTLSNFASGLMILIYRPFDVGDSVEVAGVSGKVSSLSLVSTTIKTFDNKVLILPNNSVWGDIITNVTGSTQRRVDMVFGVGYEADLAKTQSILERIVSEHELVLKDPKPTIKVHELGDSSVNFICRPWVKTDDYWTVFWDLTRTVKEEFDKAGISIPFPQRDIHVIHESKDAPPPPVPEVTAGAGEHAVS